MRAQGIICKALKFATMCLAEMPLDANHLLHQAFISYTGLDDKIGSLARKVQQSLGKHNRAAFFDVRSLEAGADYAEVIKECVQSSKVFVALLSPSFCKRYWCMYELDIALHPNSSRTIIPVLLGTEFAGLKGELNLNASKTEWEKIAEQEKLPLSEKDIQRWIGNLRMLNRRLAIDGRNYGWGGSAGWEKDAEAKVAAAIVDAVKPRISPIN